MGFNIKDQATTGRLNHLLEQARSAEANSMEKLASGSVFTSQDPMPADRAIVEKMDSRLHALTASKRNVNDAISLLQTMESSMEQVGNIVTRMKEINTSAASTTMSDQERRFLFIEYEALHDEINRISLTTEFNGIPLLDGDSEKRPKELVFRIDDPYTPADVGIGDNGEGDVNLIKFSNLESINTTTNALGILSSRDLLNNSDQEAGISPDDVAALMVPDDLEGFGTTYERALNNLANQRSMLGALESRFQRTLDFMDVYEENVQAAKSRIADTDYAQEATKLMQAKVQSQAATSLLVQTNAQSQQTIQLLNALL